MVKLRNVSRFVVLIGGVLGMVVAIIGFGIMLLGENVILIFIRIKGFILT